MYKLLLINKLYKLKFNFELSLVISGVSALMAKLAKLSLWFGTVDFMCCNLKEVQAK
jgi:hypothetical protein